MDNGYLNFDEYIRQGEPQKRDRAEAWRVAIGLHIHPTEEWKVQPNLATTGQAPHKHPTSTPQVPGQVAY